MNSIRKTTIENKGESLLSRSPYTLASSEVLRGVVEEINEMRKKGKNGLKLIFIGIERLEALGLTNSNDTKALKSIAVNITKGQFEEAIKTYKSIRFHHAYSSYAVEIAAVATGSIPNSGTRTNASTKARSSASSIGADGLVAMGGAILGTVIGSAIGGPLGGFLGGVVGGAAGAVAESCID
jgi:hypothetical protein